MGRREPSLSPCLANYLKHEVLDDPVELAPLVVHRDALRRQALVALAQVQEVGARLGARVGVQVERHALRLLVSDLTGRLPREFRSFSTPKYTFDVTGKVRIVVATI